MYNKIALNQKYKTYRQLKILDLQCKELNPKYRVYRVEKNNSHREVSGLQV